AALHGQAEELRERQQANNQKMAAMSQELAQAREHRSALKSRQAVLNDLQSRREGVSQAVRDVLAARQGGEGVGVVAGLVAVIGRTDLQNAAVIEAALGDLQHAVIVTDTKAMLADREHWTKLPGRVKVLAADRMLAWQDGYDFSRHGKAVVAAIDLVRT